MELSEAQELATLYIEEHIPSWRFKFDNAVRRFGCCNHTYRQISLSKRLTIVNDMDSIEDTIIHEIAHALVGCYHGHDSIWRQKAIALGGSGKQYYSKDDTVMPQSKYTLTCGTCGSVSSRHKLTRRAKRVACGICCNKHNGGKFSDKYLFDIKQNF